jgi:uncharacterized membrane protein (DUF2068 family)
VRRAAGAIVAGVKPSRGTIVVLIGILKLIKAAALAALGSVGLALPPEVFARGIERLALAWGLYPGHTLFGALERLSTLDRGREQRLAVLALGYAAVFAVEGVGLVFRRRWAEWLTVVVTASFIPIEVYELAHRPSAGKGIALGLNAVIVVYLARRRWREGRAEGARGARDAA